jgi:hypothetical protein
MKYIFILLTFINIFGCGNKILNSHPIKSIDLPTTRPYILPTVYPLQIVPRINIKENPQYIYMRESIVKVSTAEEVGTGFILYRDSKSTYIITDYHVVDGSYFGIVGIMVPIENHGVATFDYARFGDVVMIDARRDLALIKVSESLKHTHSIILVDDELPSIMTKVYTIGYPSNETTVLTDGIVSRYFYLDKVLMLQSSAPIVPGSSGSPIFLEDGTVAGIVDLIALSQGIHQYVPNYNIAISSYEIIQWLKGTKYEFVVNNGK